MTALSLSRLTDAAGIAKTSFYAFFPSKEALILDLLAEEAPSVHQRVMALLEEPALTAKEALSRVLLALLREYQENPFLARLVQDHTTLESIALRVRPEDLERKANWMERPLRHFFEARIASGDIRALSIDTLMDLIRSVSLLALHRNRFANDDRFWAAAHQVIDLVTEGLTKPEGGK